MVCPGRRALEDALYDSQALQRFARIDLAAEGVPDATTLLNFRHLLETHDLCKGLFTAINADLAARGLLLREGTLVDATLIATPPSEDVSPFLRETSFLASFTARIVPLRSKMAM